MACFILVSAYYDGRRLGLPSERGSLLPLLSCVRDITMREELGLQQYSLCIFTAILIRCLDNVHLQTQIGLSAMKTSMPENIFLVKVWYAFRALLENILKTKLHCFLVLPRKYCRSKFEQGHRFLTTTPTISNVVTFLSIRLKITPLLSFLFPSRNM